MADPVAGLGLDLRLKGQSINIGELVELLHSGLPLAERLDGAAKLSGDVAALRLSDLRLGVVDDRSTESKSDLEVAGLIGTIRPGHAVPLEGIDLKLQLATSTAVLSSWLKRDMPELGPVQGGFTSSGRRRLPHESGERGRIDAGAEGLAHAPAVPSEKAVDDDGRGRGRARQRSMAGQYTAWKRRMSLPITWTRCGLSTQ